MAKEVNLEEHEKELQAFLERTRSKTEQELEKVKEIIIPQTLYEKLGEIAKYLKKTEQMAIESIITSIHDHLKEEGMI